MINSYWLRQNRPKTCAQNSEKAIMEKATQDTLSLQSSDSIEDLEKLNRRLKENSNF
jgi:hypothetical protein